MVDCKCSPEDNTTFATASKDGSAIIWDGRSNRGSCFASKVPLTCLDWSPDGRSIVTGSKDCRLRVWDVRKPGECKLDKELSPLPYEVLSCSWSRLGPYIATTCADEHVRVYDSDSGVKIQKFQGHQGTITCSQWAPNGLYLASGSSDNTGKLWNIDELELEGDTSPREMTEAYEYKIENKTYLESLTSTAFDQYLDNGSPRSDFVLEREMSSSPEGSDEDPKVDGPVEDDEVPEVKPGTSLGRRNSLSTVGLRNLDILEEFRLPLGKSERYGVGGALHRKHLFSFSAKETSTSWVCKEEKELETERGVTHCALSTDASLIGATCKDKTITIFGRNKDGTYALETKLVGMEYTPTCFAFSSKTNAKGASGHSDGRVIFWDLEKGVPDFTLGGHTASVSSLSWNPTQEDLFLTSSHDSTCVVWDLKSKTAKWKFNDQEAYVRSSAWSPDGQYIATSSSDNTAMVFSLISGNRLSTFSGHGSTVYVVAWSPDSDLLATGCRDGVIQVWSKYHVNAKVTQRMCGHKSEVKSLAWSPKGNLLLSGSWDGKVIFWDPLTGEMLHSAQIHGGAVKSLAFFDNGFSFLSASLDSSVKIFQISNVSSDDEFFRRCEQVLRHQKKYQSQVSLVSEYLQDYVGTRNNGRPSSGGGQLRGEKDQSKVQVVLQIAQSALETVQATMEGLSAVEDIADSVESVTTPLDESLAALKECMLQLCQRQP